MIEPVGCNETTMWLTSCKSKLSCARLCEDNESCTAFLYSRESQRLVLSAHIHVSGFLLEDPELIIELCLEDNCTNKPFVFNVHGPPYENPRLRLNYRLNNSPEHYVYFDLNDNQFVGNSNTSVDILVTEDGYQVFIDQLFVCSFDYVLPCD
ncbi:hypothetical protein Bpfe_009626 [Biomphalaria pfeifferi]|uniref:Galectin domain-containing protein n=1 Tax=Biomphalaria pfeifferi TaxID=112525 RepID=A0AAD8FEP3_BIOPF|nr:hypothetical protein Bpfe_009626 [Biomphalaria pfeifferi]